MFRSFPGQVGARLKLPRRQARTLAAYAGAHYGKSLFWYVSELFFAFYLTELIGLPPQSMGLVLGLGLLVSAIIDGVMGWRFGGRMRDPAAAGRVQFVGALLSATTLMLVFAAGTLPPEARFAYAILVGLAFRVTYAAYDLPQNALLSLRDWPRLGRGGVSAIRLVGSGLAMMTVGAAMAFTFADTDTGSAQVRIAGVVATFAAVAVASAFLLRKALRGEGLAEKGVERPATRIEWRALLVPVGLVAVSVAGFSVFTKLEPFFGVHALGSAGWGARLAIAFSLGSMMSQPLWAYGYARMNRGALLFLLGILLLISATAFMVFAPQDPPLSVAIAFFIGALNGGFGLLLWSWFADAVAQKARGAEALAFAAFTGSSKLSLAASGIYVGLALANLDYRGVEAPILAMAMTVPSVVAAAAALATAILLARSHRVRPLPAVADAPTGLS